ncbi:MAG: gephyrin-like molybdotransferase Glp [Thiohalomonadales bacterium]
MNQKTKKPAPTCMDEFDPNALSVEQARDRIEKLVTPVRQNEFVEIGQLLNRVLAEDSCSPINVPNYVNSAMDGYAIQYSDITKNDDTKLSISAHIFAGDTSEYNIGKGECARIMTGARMPNGSDSVIMQEHVKNIETHIIVPNSITNHVTQGQNVRHIGEDISIDDTILPRGHLLRAADIALLASIGVTKAKVNRRIKVAYFSTGDELVAVGKELKIGQLYDSNRYSLSIMLTQFDAEIIDMGVIVDQQDKIEAALKTASEAADVIITTGGVSVGEADFVKIGLDKLGKVDFWKIAMKPGRPLAFGSINQTLFFGLPGNPVSTMVTFLQFVLPALRKLRGQTKLENIRLTANSITRLTKRKGRRDFQRGILSIDDSGKMVVKSTGAQGSHILRSMSLANCFIVLDEECEVVNIGDSVQVQPFCGLF